MLLLIDSKGVWSVKYTVFQKSDANIEITVIMTNLITIKYPVSSFNYGLSVGNVANFNKIHRRGIKPLSSKMCVGCVCVCVGNEAAVQFLMTASVPRSSLHCTTSARLFVCFSGC